MEETTETPDSNAAASDEAAGAVEASPVEGDVGAAEGSSDGIKRWYVLKVQSNREKSIKTALEHAVRREGMEKYFGEIIIPTEKIQETKSGRKRVVERKLYPGYIMIQMDLNDESWYLVRGTNGVGDFTGAAGKPIPMQEEEIRRMLDIKEGVDTGEAKVRIDLTLGEMVKIKDGAFESFEGTVDAIDEPSGQITVLV
ncbi:MAG: transcription termination/antitermination protein NusG, partial [Planctomycetaceae bacterium]